ncbi:MAG: DUF4402 domain-containing protein [Thermoanaerobaculia bacterium]|nr:DUF4402 domain-containing protein [Thermoanaerobaculia bacterium]
MNARRFVLAAVVLGLLTWQHRAAAGSGSAPSSFPATAVASASVRILGPADADVASGAVTLSRTGALEFEGAKAGTHVASASMVDVGGAHNAVYAITLAPEVKATSGARELSVATFPSASGGTGRLSPSGKGSVDVRAQVDITAAEASGRYAGFLPITIAFN